MDEIWVPTEASRHAFIDSGVPPDRLLVVPEPVDTNFYTNRRRGDKMALFNALAKWQLSVSGLIVSEDTFVFLFVGKFEYRKGIHILLRAFYEEFFSELGEEDVVEDAVLCILTSAYHSTNDFVGEVKTFLSEEKIVQTVPLNIFLDRIILYTGIPQVQMPALYSAADILVFRTLQ